MNYLLVSKCGMSRSVKNRDGYMCQKCGSRNELQVHHIKEWSRYPELRFEATNLLTVCKECHKKIHSKRK